jgi:HK97 family phage portal protein
VGFFDRVRSFMSGEPPLASALLRASPTAADATKQLEAEKRWSQSWGSWRMARAGDNELLKMFGDNPHLFGPVSLIAEGFAKAFQPQLYRVRGSTRQRDAISFQRSGGNLETLKQAGKLEELDDDDALRLLRRPMPGVPAMDFYELAATYFLLLGESFMTKEGRPEPGRGQPTSLNIFKPTQLQRRPDAEHPSFDVMVAGGVQPVGVLDTIWTRRINPADIFTGVGIGAGRALKDEIAIDEAMAETARARFKNHLFVDFFMGLLGSEKSGMGPPSPAQVAEFARAFEEKHRGTENAGQGHFISGDFKMQQMQHSLVEGQYIEGRDNSRRTVTRTLRVPPSKAGDNEDANRSVVDAAETMFQSACVMPLVDRFVAAFQEQLIPDFGEGLVLGCRSSVPADKEFQKSVVVAMPGLIKRNEGRALASLPPLTKEEGGDELLMNQGQSAVPVAGKVNGAVAAGGADPAQAADPAAVAAVAGGAAVQDTALNGAQVTSLLLLVDKVASGVLTVAGAKAFMQGAFPGMPEAAIDDGLAGVNKAAPEPTKPAPNGGNDVPPPVK